MRTGYIISCFCLFSLLLCAVGMAADTPTDADALFNQGKAACDAGHYGEAITPLEMFRKTYSTSAQISMASAFLYQAYLQTGDEGKATPLGEEIYTKWPRSEAAFRAMGYYFDNYRVKDPEKVLVMLADLLKRDALPKDNWGGFYANWEWAADINSRVHPEQFLTDALVTISHVKGSIDILTVRGVEAAVARRVYPLLFAAGRYDEARAIFDQFQEQYALLGNPDHLMADDAHSYYQYLLWNCKDVSRVLKETMPVVESAQWADSMQDTAESAFVAGLIYPVLFSNKQNGLAKNYHDMIMDDLHKYAHTDSVLDTEYQAYYNAMGGYFNSLVKSDSSQFWTEAAPYLEQFNTTMPATKLLELHAVAAMLYAPLLSSGRIDEAKKIHDVMQTGLKAANKLDMAQVDEVSFRDSFSTSSLDAFLSLYKKEVAGHDEANAKKWLALLNMIAPESPQASAARKIERERQQPKAN